MRKVIWKFKLQIQGRQDLIVPAGHFAPLCIQLQNGEPHLWAEVYEGVRGFQAVDIAMVGTGQNVADRYSYMGTVQHEGFVWHYYKVNN